MSEEIVIKDVECRQCSEIIDWNGKCKCERPYAPMSSEEYQAHFIHPFMRRAMPNVINKPGSGIQ